MLRALTLATGLIFPCGNQVTKADGEPSRGSNLPTLEEVRQAVSDRGTLFRSLAVHVVFQGRDQAFRGGPWRQRYQMIDAVCDSDWRVKVDMWSSPTGPGLDALASDPTKRIHCVAARTPEATRELIWSIDGKSMHGFIQKLDHITWLADPRDLIGVGRFNPSQVLRDPNRVSVERFEQVQGEDTVRVRYDSEPAGYPGSAIGITYWLCPSKGFALVQKERTFRPNAKSDVKVVERLRCQGLSPHGRLWLPSRAERQLYFYDEQSYIPMREFTVEFTGWKVDVPLDERTFTVEFPKGTIVTDHTDPSREADFIVP